ncbi:hypothetical protein NVS89_06090 [Ancylobacter sp. MQZ15Z-1]|uniref:Glutaredoxin domain-containing protein n=1 Tax=Ancylobacter mangrovi TaxID=2972472 RepID=A0A9X2T1G3_9HYPH|nr:glutaredoxin domain-containing protein [Ancylobacter mangrovi]MCS0494662.1 hypothetical protein [Ancylobacter mangrovi]
MQTQEHPFKVYWQPGCSSCVKVKEFLTSMEVPFVSVNVLAEPTGFDELLKFGVRTVPIVSKGDEFVFAQELADVAKFVGIPFSGRRLSIPQLVERWIYLLECARELITLIPDDKLEYRPVAERPRTMRDLSYHIFQSPHAFLEAMENGLEDLRTIFSVKRPDLKTKDDVLGYADSILARLKDWAARPLPTEQDMIQVYYGLQPVHGVLERSTWHSAQHIRQLAFVLDGFGEQGSSLLRPDAYDGLPMPIGVWE